MFLKYTDNIRTLSILFLKKKKTRAYCYLFCPVSHCVLINYIFSDNVRILYLSCNVKSAKVYKRVLKKPRNKCRFDIFVVPCVNSSFILLPFLAVAPVLDNTIFWGRMQQIFIQSMTAQIEPEQDKNNYSTNQGKNPEIWL